MRKRTNQIIIRLSDAELNALNKQVKRTRLSREQFCRNAIQGVTIREKPPADFPQLIQEIRRVGSNINQILMIANSQGLLNMQTNKDQFIHAIRKFMEMQTLTAPLLRELIDHIDVYETEGTGKNRT